jgi:hypothetical protein
MRRNLTFLASALISGLIGLAMLGTAQAAQFSSSLASVGQPPALIQLAGYYSDSNGDDDEGYRYKYSRRYQEKHHYDNDDDGHDNGDGGYNRHREYQSCGYKRWKRRYVCDEPSPRCFKQRECIWHYGREYCTYVRKCIGGEQYCRWKSVPSYRNCGYDD